MFTSMDFSSNIIYSILNRQIPCYSKIRPILEITNGLTPSYPRPPPQEKRPWVGRGGSPMLVEQRSSARKNGEGTSDPKKVTTRAYMGPLRIESTLS